MGCPAAPPASNVVDALSTALLERYGFKDAELVMDEALLAASSCKRRPRLENEVIDHHARELERTLERRSAICRGRPHCRRSRGAAALDGARGHGLPAPPGLRERRRANPARAGRLLNARSPMLRVRSLELTAPDASCGRRPRLHVRPTGALDRIARSFAHLALLLAWLAVSCVAAGFAVARMRVSGDAARDRPRGASKSRARSRGWLVLASFAALTPTRQPGARFRGRGAGDRAHPCHEQARIAACTFRGRCTPKRATPGTRSLSLAAALPVCPSAAGIRLGGRGTCFRIRSSCRWTTRPVEQAKTALRAPHSSRRARSTWLVFVFLLPLACNRPRYDLLSSERERGTLALCCRSRSRRLASSPPRPCCAARIVIALVVVPAGSHRCSHADGLAGLVRAPFGLAAYAALLCVTRLMVRCGGVRERSGAFVCRERASALALWLCA